MNSLLTLSYESKEVRTVTIDGEIWFVGKDVCGVLEILNTSETLNRLEEDERCIDTTYTSTGEKQVLMVNESGLYNLIFTSRKPEAKAFRRWVTKEVLPSIRKTGSYGSEYYSHLLQSEQAAIAKELEYLWRSKRVRKADIEIIKRGVWANALTADLIATMFAVSPENAERVLHCVERFHKAENAAAGIERRLL